jgi:hypothetical protein
MSSKITIKRSMTAAPPAGLSFGEMAFVQGSGNTANQLYVGLSGSSPVWVGAQIGTTGTWTDTAARTSLATQYAIDQRITSQISGSSVITTAEDNTNTTRYIVFTSGVGAGVTLGVDTAAGALSYNPAVSQLTMAGDLNVNGGDIFTTQSTATVFNSTVTSLSIGSAATGITMGYTTGNFGIRNPSLTVGSSGITGTIFADDANLVLTTKNYSGAMSDPNDSPSKIIISDVIGGGFVNVEGGDLRLGNKTISASVSGVDIVFEGTTDNTNELKLTAGDPAADYTVTLPHLTDTLVGKATSDTFTNKTYDTAGTGNVFRINAIPINAVTGTGSAAVLSVSPAITTSLTTPSSTFALLNSTATTVNFAGAATALNIGAALGTAAFAGAITVAGDLIVNGTTTTINSTTLTVDDKNIEMAAIGVPDDATANGGGIIIKGATDKSILWDSANGNLTSNQDWNLPTGKVFKINNVSVLSSSALGSGVTGSSLTQVGTITSGTWQGTAITDTYLATISTALKVSNSATTATSANTASAIVARDASGNFTAGIITGSTFSGNALTATTATIATTATNIVATEQTSGTIFLVGVAAASASTGLLVNATPATALTYDVTSGELSATLIDGGSF